MLSKTFRGQKESIGFHICPDATYRAAPWEFNQRLLYTMSHGSSAGPVRSLRLVALLVALSAELLSLGHGVQLRGNGYDGLLVAISPQVPEHHNLVPNMKEMITEASFYLFNATQRRVFFRNVQILIPATWTAHNYTKVKQESYEKADVIVTEWKGARGDDPFTLQYRGCGEEGKYIHFTPNFLLNDDLTAGYGSRGRVFVHEWAHLRWGVFDEYNHDKPVYLNGQNQVQATRCSADIVGVFICEKGLCPQDNCIISKLFKEGCTFIYNSTQNATGSIMFIPSLSSVVEFCNASTHNQEAPNLHNQMCSLRSTWDVITESSDFTHSFPMRGEGFPPPPTFSLVQAGDRVVCLVLDVSRRMAEADRLLRLQQAAEFYLMHIVENHTFVGIVSFNSKGEIRAQLQQINSHEDRQRLVSYLPTTVSTEAEASICSGLKKGFEVVEKLNGKAQGSGMILVTSSPGEPADNCSLTVLSSGSTVHTIALGSSAARTLEELSHLTGGLKFFVPDKSDFNSMIAAVSRISSGTGDGTQQSIQLDGVGEVVRPFHQWENTVTVDGAVGNDTIFLVTWQTSGPPEIVILDPNGRKYYTGDFMTNPAFRTASLRIPGTAKPGLWTYTLNNTYHSARGLHVTVASRASRASVPPATVDVFVERDSTYFPHPIIVYAHVRTGLYPILNATVLATVEPKTGDPETLRLLDNGAGADVIKNDGIYSRYFFSFAVSGRYSLTVHVHHSPSINAPAHSVPGSHAMYVPGYIENGNIQMNAPKKSGHRSQKGQQWGFNRVRSGGSFSVLGVAAERHPDMFPPCKVIDLEAVMVEEQVALSWTAPGGDFDQGQAASYEIGMSHSLQRIQDDFSNAIFVDTSGLNPQQAGARETFIFSPKLIVDEPEHQTDGQARENRRLYVAVRAVDRSALKSAVSNIALVSLPIPSNSLPALNRNELILKGVLVAIGLIGIICLIIVVTHHTLNRKRRTLRETGTKCL